VERYLKNPNQFCHVCPEQDEHPSGQKWDNGPVSRMELLDEDFIVGY
jgi:hypothetical protein